MEQNFETSQKDLNRRRLGEAGVAYSLAALLPMLLSVVLSLILMACGTGEWYLEQDWYLYLCYLLPQLCFAISIAVFYKRSGVSLKESYRGCKWYYFPVALLLEFGLMFSLSALNEYFIEFLKLFGYQEQGANLPTLSGWNLLPALLVIAVLPAVLEETLFRSVLTGQMRQSGWGLIPTVLISGTLFSLFHHNPEQTIYQFICGMAFALVAQRAGSVLPTVAAHFANNALILSLSAAFMPSGEDWAMADIVSEGGYIALLVVSALALIGALVFLIFFAGRNQKDERKGVKEGRTFFIASSVGIGLCLVQWIITLVQGFLA